MAITETLGVIGGGGWLGSALIRGAVTTSVVEPARLMETFSAGLEAAMARS